MRERFKQRITELWNYPKVTIPVREGGRYFYQKNSGLQRQSPLYVRVSLTAAPALVLDPNVLSPDGSLSLAQWMPSPDGRLLAYGLSEGGADWQTLHVRDLDKGRTWRTKSGGCGFPASRGRRTRRAFSTRAIQSRRRARCSRQPCQARRCTTTASARRSRTTGLSTPDRTCRRGSSTARSPRTDATCSSSCRRDRTTTTVSTTPTSAIRRRRRLARP